MMDIRIETPPNPLPRNVRNLQKKCLHPSQNLMKGIILETLYQQKQGKWNVDLFLL